MREPRCRVLVIDRMGYARYRDPQGKLLLPPEQYAVALITKKNLIADIEPGVCTDMVAVDTDHDLAGTMAAAERLQEIHGFDRVVALSERHILPAAEFRQRHGIAGTGPEIARLVRDKVPMIAAVRAGGIAVPEQLLLSERARVADLLARHGRIAVKPRDGTGSKGVTVVRDPAALDACYAGLDQAELDQYIAEEFIAGSVFHVDSVVEDGVIRFAICFEYLTPPYQYVNSRPRPTLTVNEPVMRERILALNAAVLARIGFQRGTTHLECFLRPSGELVFGEVAGRSGGGVIMTCIERLTGVDLVGCMVRLELGERPQLPVLPAHVVGGWVKFPPRPGRIEHISQLEDFAEDWILAAEIRGRAGDVLGTPYMSGDAVASFAVRADTSTEVRCRLNDLMDRFELVTVAELAP